MEIEVGIIIKKLVLMKMGIGNLFGLGCSSISSMKSKISKEDEINTCPRENGETIKKY